jgi:hypothetical protein
MLKVYQCDDSDLYAAESPEQAAQLWHDMVGEDEVIDDGYPRELTDAELDAEQPEFDENEARTGGTTTVRKMLAEHGTEPGWLAGSDW